MNQQSLKKTFELHTGESQQTNVANLKFSDSAFFKEIQLALFSWGQFNKDFVCFKTNAASFSQL